MPGSHNIEGVVFQGVYNIEGLHFRDIEGRLHFRDIEGRLHFRGVAKFSYLIKSLSVNSNYRFLYCFWKSGGGGGGGGFLPIW